MLPSNQIDSIKQDYKGKTIKEKDLKERERERGREGVEMLLSYVPYSL